MKPRITPAPKTSCNFAVQNALNKKRGVRERRLFCTDEEFLWVQLQLDKRRQEEKMQIDVK